MTITAPYLYTMESSVCICGAGTMGRGIALAVAAQGYSVLLYDLNKEVLADAKTDVAWGAEAGFLAGIWTFSAIAIHSLFELKSWRYIFINGGYSLVSLTLMGAIIGLWR